MSSCPICSERVRRWRVGANLTVVRCGACGHRTAEHGLAAAGGDYHAQYGDEFLGALRTTRARQAKVLLDLMRAHRPDATRILDFGCGRGWFLDEARRAGFEDIAGVDASELAVEALRARGIEAALVPPERPEVFDLATLSFRPQVVTLLDVLEHFPVEQARRLIVALRERLGGELQLLIVKVPVSRGLLYRTAAGVARLGSSGLLEQLYQVGTSPPHVSYFSCASLEQLLHLAGYDVVAHARDRDFEPESLARRVKALRLVPDSVTRGAGGVLASMIRALRMEDSLVAVAVPRQA